MVECGGWLGGARGAGDCTKPERDCEGERGRSRGPPEGPSLLNPAAQEHGSEAGDARDDDGRQLPVPVQACVDEERNRGPCGRGYSGREARADDVPERVEQERREQEEPDTPELRARTQTEG